VIRLLIAAPSAIVRAGLESVGAQGAGIEVVGASGLAGLAPPSTGINPMWCWRRSKRITTSRPKT
jgi:hypothetical protein